MPRAFAAVRLACVLVGTLSHAYAQSSETHTQPPLQHGTGPLHYAGAKLLDANGLEVRITDVNWFGLETDTFAPHGLWACNYGEMLDQIAAAGFNTVRLPHTNQLFGATSVPKGIDEPEQVQSSAEVSPEPAPPPPPLAPAASIVSQAKPQTVAHAAAPAVVRPQVAQPVKVEPIPVREKPAQEVRRPVPTPVVDKKNRNGNRNNSDKGGKGDSSDHDDD